MTRTHNFIELDRIVIDPATQPRCAISTEKIAEYVEDMQRGDTFPPLVVFKDGKKYWLADGFHRYYAAVTCRRSNFECEVRDGGLREAILYSCGANASHGLRRTTADKRRAVVKMLEDEEWSCWADREIARQCCVSHEFVGKMRKEAARVTVSVDSEERTYRTKHGTLSTMNTANIGQSGADVSPPPLKPIEIANALRTIERQVDSMPAAEEAVAHFPTEQWYFFPLSKIEAIATWMAAFAQAWRQRAETP